MIQEYKKPNETNIDSKALEEMANYGITCSQINQFAYGDYRYTNLEDAIAEAKRHPRAG